MNNPDLSSLTTYCHWTQVTVRYSDQDTMGHVNNCSYAAYVEQSRVRFIRDLLDLENQPNIDFLLANVSINYLKEMHFPATLDVGARVLKLGNKSVTTGYGIFIGEICYSTATSINVFLNLKTRETVLMPDHIRTILEDDPTLSKRVK